jgi:uncharacterized membrane protein
MALEETQYRRYEHSQLQNVIIHLLDAEGCIYKKDLQKRLAAHPISLHKAVKALERKGLVKIIKLNGKPIVCLNI